MSKKPVFLMFLAIILMGVLGASFNVHKVEAQLGTIYIRADGSVDPSTANITTSDNVTYTFTADINASIVVEKNNTVVDGAGYTLQGTGSETGVEIFGRTNVTIQNLVISNFHSCIQIWASSKVEIIDNDLMAPNGGIRLGGTNNTLYKNSIQAKYIGIDISGSYNTISGNNITNCTTGFFFGMDTVYNTVSRNNIENNTYGLYFEQASNHSIIGNNIANNTYGILLDYYSLNMRIHHNTFSNNTNQMDSNPDNPNFLDNGVEGNYWSNYTGNDLDHNGIGDTNHTINTNNVDMYPLMGPFHSFKTPPGYYVNVISNSTLEGFQYFESNSTIKMYVSNVTANQTRGFCRVSIPYEVMSEPFNVTIDGANPTYWNYTLYDNGTHRWIYFEYEHTTREIVIIPEFPSFLILPLFMIATLLAVLVYRRKQ